MWAGVEVRINLVRFILPCLSWRAPAEHQRTSYNQGLKLSPLWSWLRWWIRTGADVCIRTGSHWSTRMYSLETSLLTIPGLGLIHSNQERCAGGIGKEARILWSSWCWIPSHDRTRGSVMLLHHVSQIRHASQSLTFSTARFLSAAPWCIRQGRPSHISVLLLFTKFAQKSWLRWSGVCALFFNSNCSPYASKQCTLVLFLAF